MAQQECHLKPRHRLTSLPRLHVLREAPNRLIRPMVRRRHLQITERYPRAWQAFPSPQQELLNR
jgi:hypothetical protein